MPPVRVAQHDDGRLAERPVVVGPEQAAERRLQAEHREVAARDEHALCRSASGPR